MWSSSSRPSKRTMGTSIRSLPLMIEADHSSPLLAMLRPNGSSPPGLSSQARHGPVSGSTAIASAPIRPITTVSAILFMGEEYT